MKRHAVNAAYGVLDYVVYPLGMLLVAPIVLHGVGAEEYGIWTITTGIVSVGGVIASGFCDANLQRVAKLRFSAPAKAVVDTVRSILSINLLLGAALALLTWLFAPYGAVRISATHSLKAPECVMALRISSVLILMRAIETVGTSTQRAFEEFGSTIRISTGVRLITLGTVASLASSGHGTISFLIATGVIMGVGTAAQLFQVKRLLGTALWPTLERQSTLSLLRFGAFTWIQAVGSVLFGQLDRIMLGLALGAMAVVPYSLCVQFAHPIYGLTASALSFLFPYLSVHVISAPHEALRKSLLKALTCNFLLVLTGASLLLWIGPPILRAWTGPSTARAAQTLLPWVVVGSALMGLSVTPIYALLAMGVFRVVALVNLSVRLVVLGLMWIAIRHTGLSGLAVTRAAYGAISLLIYLPMFHALRARSASHKTSELTVEVAY